MKLFQQSRKRIFSPNEIIFSVTDSCNLHCEHCYVSRKGHCLNQNDAKVFLESCKSSQNCKIDTIGFSGGEPFLNLNFITEVCKYAVQNDFMFDRIITNGCWYNDKSQLEQKLSSLYESGFDGKIAISWDSFHGQKTEQIADFCKAVFSIWNNFSMIEFQSVVNENCPNFILEKLTELAKLLNCSCTKNLDKKTNCGTIILENENTFIKTDVTPQCFESSNSLAWKSKKWFEEDFCEGPGQLLFVHPNGNIAPCCGFANECKELFIGNIFQTFETVMKQANENKMVKLCYEKGLSNLIKKTKTPGKTNNPCTFCQFICNQIL